MIPVFFINLVLAGALGGLLGGELGIGIGLGVGVLFGIALQFAPKFVPDFKQHFANLKPTLPPLPEQPRKAPLLLPALPSLPKLALPSCVGAFIAGIGPFFRGFFSERVLPFTIGNVVLVLLGAGLVLGVQVALYTALIAVPVVIVTLMLMAVYSGPSED